MQDAVNAALARRAEAQGNFYATNTHRMLAELDREERGQPAPSPVRRENRTIRKGEK